MWNSALYVCWLHYGAVKQICLGSMLNVQFVKYTYLWSMVCSSILPSPLWNIMKSIVVSKDIWLVCQVDTTNLLVHFAKMQSPHYSIVKYMFLCPHSEGSNSTLSTRQHCKIVITLWTAPNELQFAHNYKNSGLSNVWYFSDLPKILPQKIRLPLD